MGIKIRAEQLNDYNLLVDIYHNNIVEIMQSRKARKFTHASYSKKVADEHHIMLVAALNKPMRKDIVTAKDKKIISKNNWKQLYFMNPHRIIPCQEATLRAIEAYCIPLEGVSAFTVIEKEFDTTNTAFIKEADELDNKNCDIYFEKIKKKFQKKMWGYNYICMMEFAIFEKVIKSKKVNSWHISPHFQGIIWKNGGIGKADIKNLNNIFSGGMWEATGCKHEAIYNITGSVAYMHKLPLFHYYKSYEHTSRRVSQDTTFLMFQRLKKVPFEKLFISGGEGQKVRTVAINYLKDFYQEYSK